MNRVNTYTGIAYKNDPTILAWELANEPRAYTDSTGSILNPWINEMAQYIKGIDSNHLLSAGVEGWYGYKDWYGSPTGVDFVTSQSSPYIDIATFHLFPDYYNLSEVQSLQWISNRASSAQNSLGKPVYIGEFGKMVDRAASNAGSQMKARNDLYKNIYNTASSSGVDGLGFWLLSGHQDDGSLYPDYDHFTVYYPEDRSTSRVIKSGSALFVPASGRGGRNKNSTSITTTADSYELVEPVGNRSFGRVGGSVVRPWLRSSDIYRIFSDLPAGFNLENYLW
ncbi:MAG: cellulase family glycosylhydrolase [Candidatus Omnitrophica bacterium]|nr:cellulase family glycosylhydrolase [Candidatus Omnitrophota bacterium]